MMCLRPTRFDIVARNKAEFTLTKDGRVLYRPSSAASGLEEESRTVGSDPYLLCMAPVGTWTGMCMRVWQAEGKGYYCTGVFGTRAKWRRKCEIRLP